MFSLYLIFWSFFPNLVTCHYVHHQHVKYMTMLSSGVAAVFPLQIWVQDKVHVNIGIQDIAQASDKGFHSSVSNYFWCLQWTAFGLNLIKYTFNCLILPWWHIKFSGTNVMSSDRFWDHLWLWDVDLYINFSKPSPIILVVW